MPTHNLKKILASLFAIQGVDSLGSAVGISIGPVLAVKLTGGNVYWTGVPIFLVLLFGAVSAFLAKNHLDRKGYRFFFQLSLTFQLVGSALVFLSILWQSLASLLAGLVTWGLGRGLIGFGRYAASEISPPDFRARAMGIVTFGGALGALLAGAVGGLFTRAAGPWEIPPEGGPLLGCMVLFSLSFLNVVFVLRPEPKRLAEKLAAADLSSQPKTAVVYSPQGKDPFAFGVFSLIFGQLVMVMIMSITPVHLHHQHYHPSQITTVIGLHIFGMFCFSYPIGWLLDKFGLRWGLYLGSGLLFTSCVLAGTLSGYPWVLFSLFLLGVGWNFCFIFASQLVVRSSGPGQLGRRQGVMESTVLLTSALTSISSGFALGFSNFTVIATAAGLCALLPVLGLLWFRRGLAL